ncbi:MAG TPA: NAD(P)-dependent oxidoreductase [Candidatus Dormibacteraeota bacterium]|jgi:3-hydroxyisobutyrate dehydrogenase-like beta-hydroxyacid dehydrogenase|nr:NAD(P)-dependent oxidoreductase [Candidatus Dormibacteraeota bacterium]
MRVTLLGTGRMGTAIARRIAAAGHELRLWNRTRRRADEVGAGEVFESPADAADGADVVLSILFDATAVGQVYAALAPRPGQVLVDMSTAGPHLPEQLAQQVREAGADFLQAPIVGSIPAIDSASAMILVGGDEAVLERVTGVLEAFGQPRHVGTPAQAASLKLINNAMLGAVSAFTAEMLAAADREGLDAETTFGLLSRMVPYLSARRRGYIERSHDNPMFELRAMRKDLDLALDAGHEAGAALPLLASVRELFAMAEPAHADEEITGLIEEYAR